MVRVFLSRQGLLEEDDRHHLARVLRLKPGDPLVLVKDGQAYEGLLGDNFSQDGQVHLGQKILEEGKTFQVHLLQGLGKGQKFEEVLEHGTEVGVDAFYPIQMVRSIRKVQGKEGKLLDRWAKILKKAAKQSRRLQIPQVHQPLDLGQALEVLPEGTKLLCFYEEEDHRTLDMVLRGDEENIALVIGPEGGLDPKEVDLIKDYGGHCVSLGKRILRTETAALIASDRVHVFMEGGAYGKEGEKHSYDQPRV